MVRLSALSFCVEVGGSRGVVGAVRGKSRGHRTGLSAEQPPPSAPGTARCGPDAQEQRGGGCQACGPGGYEESQRLGLPAAGERGC